MAIVTGIVMLMMVFNVIVSAVLRSFLQMDVGHMVLRMTMPYSGEGSRSGS